MTVGASISTSDAAPRYTHSMAFSVTYTDPAQLSDRQLLLLLLERVTTMSDKVDAETAAETALAAQVELLLTAFAAAKGANATQATQIAALQAQVATMQANGVITAADGAKLDAALADMQAKATEIATALTPPPPPPSAP